MYHYDVGWPLQPSEVPDSGYSGVNTGPNSGPCRTEMPRQLGKN